MVKKYLKANKKELLISFLVPILIFIIAYAGVGVFPFFGKMVNLGDSYNQFINFYGSFKDVLSGKESILYTWNSSLGLNYLAFISYYLGGVFTYLAFFVPKEFLPEFFYFLTLLKVGLASLAFYIMANYQFNLKSTYKVILAISYSTMSFIFVFSEMIMWLDVFIYLPLVVLGIISLIKEGKFLLLFLSQFLIFSSNFYMGYMIGIFSILFFITQYILSNRLDKIIVVRYFFILFLSTCASLFILLPTILDISSNGESFNSYTSLFTDATQPLDLIVKNMVGIYDTTKFGSTPFVYAGLLPLIFLIFFFLSTKFKVKEKIVYLSLILIFVVSFYLEPLNLFWQGMHSPIMFLFRYSYLFSFLLVYLAALGLERYDNDYKLVYSIIIILIVVFSFVYLTRTMFDYHYISTINYIITILLLSLYLIVLSPNIITKFKVFKSSYSTIIILLVIVESLINGVLLIQKVDSEWYYLPRNAYTQNFNEVNTLVNITKDKNQNKTYRLENNSAPTVNESLNVGYSGINQFTSIRNRNSSLLLDKLGYRSRGTNLITRYNNNTLLMDSIIGIKYLLSQELISNYGYEYLDSTKNYHLYENKNNIPYAFVSETSLEDYKLDDEVLKNQTELLNKLVASNSSYFNILAPKITYKENTLISTEKNKTTFSPVDSNNRQVIEYEINIPENSQVYYNLYPLDYSEAASTSISLFYNGKQNYSNLADMGQFFNLGYYKNKSNLKFTLAIDKTDYLRVEPPTIVILDVNKLQYDMNKLKSQSFEMQRYKNRAWFNVQLKQDQTIITTLPYSTSWSATVNGKKIKINSLNNGFVALNLSKGNHNIELKFIPKGFYLGTALSIFALIIFSIYYKIHNNYVNKRKINHYLIE